MPVASRKVRHYRDPMAKKKQPVQQQQPTKRYPSRNRVRSVNVPTEFHDALEAFRQSRSEPFDKKSIAWAVKQALLKGLDALGYPVHQARPDP